MYMDNVLLIIGAVMLAVAAALGVWLLIRCGRSREIRRILRKEAEKTNVMETLRSMSQAAQTGTETLGTATITQTEPLPSTWEDEKTEILPSADQGGLPKKEVPLSGAETATLRSASTGTATLGLVSTGIATLPPTETGITETLPSGSNRAAEGLDDVCVLDGKYELIREIHGGGMSRVYLGRNVKLGNEWIVKYVSNEYALVNEADVMKKLNHISLPQIVDIIPASHGTFLVERFIEGLSLDKVMEKNGAVSEEQICDWAMQLTQVLRYLHTQETPIIHCDLKPSNIMVTHDNRLVLIDFGISRMEGKGVIRGITPDYAAPEQFFGSAKPSPVSKHRFGQLPAEAESWRVDTRTDIYSTGVILYQLVTGHLPEAGKTDEIYDFASHELAGVTLKCIEMDPSRRFQNDDELSDAIQEVERERLSIPRTLLVRRITAICCAAALTLGTAATASGAYVRRVEDSAVVSMEPSRVIVSLQQGVSLRIQKDGGFGGGGLLLPGQIQWTYSKDNIARMDDDRLVGINLGETILYGQYRNRTVELHVTVTEPVRELTEISLRYPEGTAASHFAGNGDRDSVDGPLSEASFVSPESLAPWRDGMVIADSGVLRFVSNDTVSTAFLDPFYLTADKVRTSNDDIYVLTGPWEDVSETLYGIAKVTADGRAELLYTTQAAWSVTTDFAVDENGSIWFVQQNMGTGATCLYRMNGDGSDLQMCTKLPDGASGLALDGEGGAYISVPESGVILKIPAGKTEWEYFAGVEGERNFIDGPVANFYMPTSLVLRGGDLFVLDFDTVRKIHITDGTPEMTETIAGTPEAETAPPVTLGPGHTATLPASQEAELLSTPTGLLLSDPKNSCIYEVNVP